jgi:hypothetical protein
VRRAGRLSRRRGSRRYSGVLQTSVSLPRVVLMSSLSRKRLFEQRLFHSQNAQARINNVHEHTATLIGSPSSIFSFRISSSNPARTHQGGTNSLRIGARRPARHPPSSILTLRTSLFSHLSSLFRPALSSRGTNVPRSTCWFHFVRGRATIPAGKGSLVTDTPQQF